MERKPVVSSNVVSIGYNPFDKILQVEYQGGRIYNWMEVDPEVHQELMASDSIGRFMANFQASHGQGLLVDDPDDEERTQEPEVSETWNLNDVEVLDHVKLDIVVPPVIDGLEGAALAAHLVEKHDHRPETISEKTDGDLLAWHAKDHTAMSHD